MQLKQSGFSLIELLLYLAMSSVCVLTVCCWASQIISSNVLMYQQQRVDRALLAAIDCCVRDIWRAPMDRSDWLHTDATWIEWRQGNTTIGYRLHNQKIMRTASSHTKKKHASQIATAVHTALFTLQIDKQRVIGVLIELCLKDHGIERRCRHYVALRNGVY